MCIQVAIARSEDETASQLQGVLSQLVLAMATGASAFAGCSVIAPKKVEQRGAASPSNAIHFAFLIDKQRKRDAGLFPEELGVVPIAQSNGRDADSSAPEFCLVFAQLRDVLAAEDSAIVPQKSHHCWRLCPDRSKHDLIVIGIWQPDACQPCAE
jgi:hypothetical protein